jgi:hypothetical protein
MNLPKIVKKEIEIIVGNKVWVDFEIFDNYKYHKSHELILDNGMTAHTKRCRLRTNMNNYCIKLINKNKVKRVKGRC